MVVPRVVQYTFITGPVKPTSTAVTQWQSAPWGLGSPTADGAVRCATGMGKGHNGGVSGEGATSHGAFSDRSRLRGAG